jgi:serine/threonine protein kinase
LKKSGQKLSESEILRIFRGIVAGVKDIHKRDLVHRDLKPANVLLTDDLIPILCDMGSLAKDNIQINNIKEARTLQDLASERYKLKSDISLIFRERTGQHILWYPFLKGVVVANHSHKAINQIYSQN